MFVSQINEEVNPVITFLMVRGKPAGRGGTLTQSHRIYMYMSPDPHPHPDPDPDPENCAIPFPITCCPSAHTHTDMGTHTCTHITLG